MLILNGTAVGFARRVATSRFSSLESRPLFSTLFVSARELTIKLQQNAREPGMRLTGMMAAIMACLVWNVATAADQQQIALIKQLESGNLDERTRAAQGLGEIGLRAAAAVPALIKLVGSDDLALRHEVVLALGRINSNSEQVVPVLIRVLSDKSPLLQHGAIESLRMFGPDAKAALPQLTKLMEEENDVLINVSAARAIVDIDDNIKRAIAVLVAGLSHENLGIAQEATHGLVAVGPQAVPSVMTLLDNARPQTGIQACHTLTLIGPDAADAVDRLLNLMNSKNVELRWHAIHALGVIGAKPEQVVPALVKHLQSDSPLIRFHAAQALGDLGPAGAPAVPALVGALKDADLSVRRAAADSLGEIGPAAKASIPALVAALDDAAGSVTLNAIESLGQIGKASVPALLEKLKEQHFQLLATTVLGEIGPDASEAVPALTGLLNSKNIDVRREAMLTLASICPASKSAAPELLRILEDKQSTVRPAAAYALGRLGAKEAASVLKISLDAPNDPMLGLTSIWALLQLEPNNEDYAKIAVPRLVAALTNDRPRVRLEAATTLGKLGPQSKSAVAALQKSLKDDHHEVRVESLVALAEIGVDSQPAVSDIIELLREEDPNIRFTSGYALGQIGPPAMAAVPHLRRMLQSRDGREKTVAAWALVKIAPDPETVRIAIPLLATALQKSERPDMRAVVAKTLGEIGTGSQAALTALNDARKDSDESVRKAAEEALGKLK